MRSEVLPASVSAVALLETAAVRPAEQIGFIDPSRPGSVATTVTPASRSPACDTQTRQVATRTAPAQAAIWAPAPGKARGRPVAVQVFGWRSGAASTSSSAAATVLRQALSLDPPFRLIEWWAGLVETGGWVGVAVVRGAAGDEALTAERPTVHRV